MLLLASLNTCLNIVWNDTSLWHRHMGHVSHNSLKETIGAEAIRGVPNLKGKPERICGPCELGNKSEHLT